MRDTLLIRYNLINEGELFCSDFKFRFTDQKSRDFIGVLGKSNEETVMEISQELDKIIKKYRDKFKKFLEEKGREAEQKEMEEKRRQLND